MGFFYSISIQFYDYIVISGGWPIYGYAKDRL